MTVYERVEGGRVVERVSTVENSMEDNRLGLAALDPASPWRLEDADQPDPEPAPQPEPDPEPAPEPASDPTPAPRTRRGGKE